MKKKILAFVLLAALLLNAFPAYAASAPTFRVDTVTAEAGDTVEVTIWIENNPGLASTKLAVEYAPELTLTGVAFNSVLGMNVATSPTLTSPAILNWCSPLSELSGDLYFAKLTFTVAEGAAAGTYPISVTYDPDNVYNLAEDNVTFEVINGAVVIEAEEVVIPVSGVVLDKDTLSLTEGETAVLTATVVPADAANKEVVFVSENPAVATVDGTGVVTAMKAGTTTISVNTVDGGYYADCVVTVSCAHSSTTSTQVKEPTCTEQGWDAYESCDDCGQLFDGAGEEIDEIPFRPATGVHTGGTATCTELAVCTSCGAKYGTLAVHHYTAEVKSEATLSKAGTCGEEALYFYSCSVCGAVEGDKTHTFKGEKDINNHSTDTAIVGQTDPDHKNQIDGYTGDQVCVVCQTVRVPGSVIPAEPHAAGSVLYKDPTGHWKVCTVDGCGVQLEKAAHTPDHTGGATEDYAIVCTACGYVIEEQLAHTHVYNKEVAEDAYKVSDATCQKKAVYHKSCACGAAGTDTFEYGEVLGHKWVDATCETAKTCSVCGETEGKALGHKWTDATCETAKTCSVCGETEGKALGHKWTDATCETAKTCTVCGETEGKALGHKWTDATCETAKTCSVCGETEGEALGHTPDREEATETEPVKCTVCGETLKPALGHTHKAEKVEGKDPTCTEAGQKTYYVCKCGKWFADSTANVEITDKTSVIVEKLGHKWVDATCETAKTCSVCGETEGEALGHKWADATCETAKTCSICGETEGEALGHKWADATCETAKTCSVCGETEGEALGHKWADATCETAKTCSVCGETEGKALGHKWADATCEVPKTCSVCGETEGEALGHKWADATCEAPKTCSVCGETEGEALCHTPDREEATETEPVKCTVCGETLKPALGHTHKAEKVEGKDPTCTEAGQKTYYVCKCGKWFADSTANVEIIDKNSVMIEKLGHKWTDATCETAKTCSVCGETEGEALGHKWTDATCETAKTCSVCGETEGEALGHKWTDATCETAKTCSVCGETEGEALGHKWADATCETAKTCSVCGETEGKALGHKWADATCETAKTCSVCGETEGEALGHKWTDATCETAKTCSVCGETEGEALGHTPDREEATETEPVKCTVCGETLKPALGHTHMTTKVEGKDPTCTEAGQKTYYTCKCGMWFADSTANVEIADKNSVILEKLGHTWADATCEAPKTCSVCGETEGEKLEHKWVDATCTEPKTCALCGLTEGEALGHGETEQKTDNKGHWDACKVCGQMVSEASQAHVDADGDEKCDDCSHVMVKPGTPQTGDSTIHLLVLAMLLSLMGASVLVSKKKSA